MELLNELLNCKCKLDVINNSIVNTMSSIDSQIEQIEKLDAQLNMIIKSQQYYKNAIDIIYDRSIQELKDVLNSALNFIFSDRDYNIDINLVDKRGKAIKFTILDNGKEVNLKRGMGMGVKCVISAILHIYYLQCKNSPILMLDEAYSNIDEEHIAPFFEFISKLCDKLNFVVIIITHDKRFKPYASKLYKINKGVVSLEVCGD